MTDNDWEAGDNLKNEKNRPEDSTCAPIESIPVHRGMEIFSRREYSKYAWYQIDDSSLPLLAQIEPSLRRRYLEFGLLPGPRRYELGRFRLHQNHLAVFEAIPALNEVAYTEVMESTVDPSSKLKVNENNSSPISAFLELSDKSDPVPEILVELDESSDDDHVVRLLRDRDVIDSLDPVGGRRAEFELEAAPAAAAVWTCFNGGLNAFQDAYCSDWDISYCDNGAWTHLVRTSGSSTRRHSFTRVASCFGTAQVWHYWRGYWFGWKWFVASEPFEPAQQLVAPGHVRSRHHIGGSKRRRKVEVSTWSYEPSQYFRVFTSFHN
jgi:hypothetical protein